MPTPVGSLAFMRPGSAMPGAGFAIIRVPADVSWVWLDPAPVSGLMLGLSPVTITSCGERFRLVGFAYPLAGTLRINPSTATRSLRYTVPRALSAPQPSLAAPQIGGVWQDMDTARAQVAAATLATGRAFGQRWSIQLGFGTAHLTARLSTGATFSVTPVVAAGRRYAAFFVPGPAHLTRLNWDNAAGQEIAGIQDLPDYGYTQFQP
jgi:hypothetical protein